MKLDVDTAADYLASLEGEQLALVRLIRTVIQATDPGIEEGMRYGMLDYPGLANLAAQRHHVALYVAPEILERHKTRFPGIDAGKSCLRFKRFEQADPKRIRALLRDVKKHRMRTSRS